jgi:hypothetical protein
MALEATIADTGALLVQLDKFRAGASLHAALLAEALALGDRARRHLRAQALDASADAALTAGAAALQARVQRALDDVRGSAPYRDAVAAHAGGDHAALTRLLPLVFDGLTPVPAPPFLWHAPTWLRRNRPRPAFEMAAVVERIATAGLEADADPMAPGIDPALPAVPLDTMPSPADPVLLRWSHDDVPPAVFRLDASDAIVVHVARLTAPFTVVLPTALDEDELGEVSLDHPRYRAELLAAFADAKIAVAGG